MKKMKINLSSIEPIQYNDLFCTFRSKKSPNIIKNKFLPQICNSFRTRNPNLLNSENKLRKIKRNPDKNIYSYNETDFSYPSVNGSFYKNSSTLKTKLKKNKILKNDLLKVININLYNSNDFSINNKNCGNFFSNKKISKYIDELDSNNESQICNSENKNMANLKQNFNLKKLQELLYFVDNIPNNKSNFNKTKIYDDKIEKNENKKEEKNNETYNIKNVFFKWAVDNEKKKIEFKNQYNKELTFDVVNSILTKKIKKMKEIEQLIKSNHIKNINDYIKQKIINIYKPTSPFSNKHCYTQTNLSTKITSKNIKRDDSNLPESKNQSSFFANLNKSFAESKNKNKNRLNNLFNDYNKNDIDDKNFLNDIKESLFGVNRNNKTFSIKYLNSNNNHFFKGLSSDNANFFTKTYNRNNINKEKNENGNNNENDIFDDINACLYSNNYTNNNPSSQLSKKLDEPINNLEIINQNMQPKINDINNQTEIESNQILNDQTENGIKTENKNEEILLNNVPQEEDEHKTNKKSKQKSKNKKTNNKKSKNSKDDKKAALEGNSDNIITEESNNKTNEDDGSIKSMTDLFSIIEETDKTNSSLSEMKSSSSKESKLSKKVKKNDKNEFIFGKDSDMEQQYKLLLINKIKTANFFKNFINDNIVSTNSLKNNNLKEKKVKMYNFERSEKEINNKKKSLTNEKLSKKKKSIEKSTKKKKLLKKNKLDNKNLSKDNNIENKELNDNNSDNNSDNNQDSSISDTEEEVEILNTLYEMDYLTSEEKNNLLQNIIEIRLYDKMENKSKGDIENYERIKKLFKERIQNYFDNLTKNRLQKKHIYKKIHFKIFHQMRVFKKTFMSGNIDNILDDYADEKECEDSSSNRIEKKNLKQKKKHYFKMGAGGKKLEYDNSKLFNNANFRSYVLNK